jgi:hypothetical protein
MDIRKHNMLLTVHYTPKMCIIKSPNVFEHHPNVFGTISIGLRANSEERDLG